MERFLNKKVTVELCLGGVEGGGTCFTGILTSLDDEYACINNNIFIVRKYIMAIIVK